MEIKQRSGSDCNICTIAMALDVSYDDVIEACFSFGFNPHHKGTALDEEEIILELFGYRRDIHFKKFFCNPGYINSYTAKYVMMWGRRGIISTMSINNKDGHHSVYWDGNNLFDPSNKKQWDWRELNIDSVVIFNETKWPKPEKKWITI